MTSDPPRPTLEDDLAQARQTGNAAREAHLLSTLARVAVEEGERGLAHGLYGQAWNAYQRANDLRGAAGILLALRDFFARPNPFEPETLFLAERFESYALKLYEQAGDLPQQAAIWFKRGDEMAQGRFMRDHHAMVAAFEKAMALYLTLNDRHGQASIFAVFGKLEMADSPHRARPLFEKALALFGSESTRREKAHVLYDLGQIALRQKRPADALVLLKESQEIYELTPTSEDEQPAFSRYEQLGDVARQVGDHVLARHYLERVLHLYEAGSKYQSWGLGSLARILHKLGAVVSTLGDHAAADQHFQRAHTIFVDHRKFDNQVKVLRDWARSKAEAGDLTASRHYYGEALALNTRFLNEVESPAILWDWGQSEYQTGDRQSGYDYCRRALQDLTAYRRDEDTPTLQTWVRTLARMKPSGET